MIYTFGIKKSDTTFQASQLRFFNKQLVEELQLRNIDTIFVLGDVFDTRQNINVKTMNVVYDLFSKTFANFKVYVIVGNHDLYYTDTTACHSLKMLSSLSNVKVYSRTTVKTFDGVKVTFLPWITPKAYAELSKTLTKTEYCFGHLDIAGFMMDKYNMSSNGCSVKILTEHFKHVYTGHFHTRSKKQVGNCDIEYIGSPYQLTRIDADQDRGCTILDLATNKTEFIVNTESIRYIKLTYPNIPTAVEQLVTNNIVDIEIPYEFSDNSKDIFEYSHKLAELNPVKINQTIGNKPELTVECEQELNLVDLYSLFKTYTDQLKVDNSERIYNELKNLYNMCKGE